MDYVALFQKFIKKVKERSLLVWKHQLVQKNIKYIKIYIKLINKHRKKYQDIIWKYLKIHWKWVTGIAVTLAIITFLYTILRKNEYRLNSAV